MAQLAKLKITGYQHLHKAENLEKWQKNTIRAARAYGVAKGYLDVNVQPTYLRAQIILGDDNQPAPVIKLVEPGGAEAKTQDSSNSSSSSSSSQQTQPVNEAVVEMDEETKEKGYLLICATVSQEIRDAMTIPVTMEI